MRPQPKTRPLFTELPGATVDTDTGHDRLARPAAQGHQPDRTELARPSRHWGGPGGWRDTAVLIALTARQLNPRVTIVAAVREEENQDLLRRSGADHVVVSSGAAGQLLAISAARPAVGRVIAGLLDRGRGLDLAERPVAAAEAGTPARDADDTVIALLRGDDLLPADHPDTRRLAQGDRLIVVSSRQRPGIGHDITEPREFAHASHHL